MLVRCLLVGHGCQVAPALGARAGRIEQHRAGGFEERPPVVLVGFEVVSLRPFVPGHDEQEVLLLADTRRRGHRAPQPVLVGLRRRSLVEGGPVPPTRGVVPARHDRGKTLPGGCRPAEVGLEGPDVIDDAVPPVGLGGGEGPAALQGHEPDGGVEAEGLGTAGRHAVALDPAEVEVGESQPLRLFAPDLRRSAHVGQELGAVDEHQRPAVDLDVAVVGEGPAEPPDVGEVVLVAERLGHQHLAAAGVPVACPFLVGPAEGEGEVGGPGSEHLVEGPLEESLPVEPVVVVDEARDAVFGRQGGLGLANLGHPQVVVAEFARYVRLEVAGEEGLGPRDVGPLGEAAAPPLVVLGDGVELGQVEGERPGPARPGAVRTPLGSHGAIIGQPDASQAVNGPGRGPVAPVLRRRSDPHRGTGDRDRS